MIDEAHIRYLMVNLGAETYGIPLTQVKEVISVPDITPIPFAPPFCLGAMNLRGKVVTVTDLRIRLGISDDRTRHTSVVICDLEPLTIGIIVDSVDRVIAIPQSQIQSSSRVQGDSRRDFFTGIYDDSNKLHLLIDPARAIYVHSYLGKAA